MLWGSLKVSFGVYEVPASVSLPVGFVTAALPQDLPMFVVLTSCMYIISTKITGAPIGRLCKRSCYYELLLM